MYVYSKCREFGLIWIQYMLVKHTVLVGGLYTDASYDGWQSCYPLLSATFFVTRCKKQFLSHLGACVIWKISILSGSNKTAFKSESTRIFWPRPNRTNAYNRTFKRFETLPRYIYVHVWIESLVKYGLESTEIRMKTILM